MLSKHNMLFINQLNAQIKLTEMWKASNIEKYPLDIKKFASSSSRTGTQTKGVTKENLIEPMTKATFVGDATRIWNKAPDKIRQAKTLQSAKKEI